MGGEGCWLGTVPRFNRHGCLGTATEMTCPSLPSTPARRDPLPAGTFQSEFSAGISNHRKTIMQTADGSAFPCKPSAMSFAQAQSLAHRCCDGRGKKTKGSSVRLKVFQALSLSPGTQSGSVPLASCRITPSAPRGTAPRPSACASTEHTRP